MSGYNILRANPTCPHDGYTGTAEAEFRFGLLDYHDYVLGDRISWGEGGGLRNPKIRPEGGNYTGEGYVVCDSCHLDYWVDITVVDDVITSMEVNTERKGYIPDPAEDSAE